MPQPAAPGIVSPALPDALGARLRAIQHHLEASQWWPAETMRATQLQQLDSVLRHAYATVPFWRARLDAAAYYPARQITGEWLATLPVLGRRDLQHDPRQLLSASVPAAHSPVGEGETSGSTGMPIRFFTTAVTHLFWQAITFRDHLWHGRVFSAKMAVIRSKAIPRIVNGWGPPWDSASARGVCAVLNIDQDIDTQLRWLQQQDPDYLLTYSSALRALARRSLETGVRLRRLKEARSFGETLHEGMRDLCRQAWGVALTDMYSAEEVGYIALQCPEHQHYHVQAETLLVEILDEKGHPCAPGQIGRVVITTLQNFAMPLIRYAIGDYAEAGAPCSCGRGLPVIRRVMGRQRNILTLPDGRQYWPRIRDVTTAWQEIVAVHQVKLIQRTLTNIELQYVADRPVTPDETARIVGALQERLGFAFGVALLRVEQIERAASHKFEDFESKVSAPPPDAIATADRAKPDTGP